MTAPPRLILASGSPRRRVLLRRAGFTFTVLKASVDETRLGQEAPESMVARLAAAKATAPRVLGRAIVLGADTTVALGDDPIAKPVDEDDAVAMLLQLGGRTHDVFTGFALAASGRVVASGVERSRVTFGPIDEQAARAYVATGEPMDKAGGYAIQGMGRRFVTEIDGSFTNVMGLPMERVEPALLSHGIPRTGSRDRA